MRGIGAGAAALVLFLAGAGAAGAVPSRDADYRTVTGTVRVSVTSTGQAPAAGHSLAPAISADGRFVAFESEDDALVPGDTNERTDIFVHDRGTGRTGRVSVTGRGGQADGASAAPSISGDGRFVVFVSEATNLVAGDTNRAQDVFLRDRRSGRTTRVNLAADGRELEGGASAVISRSGRFIAYTAGVPLTAKGTDEDLAGMFVRDRVTGKVHRLPGLAGHGLSISADGRYVAFASEARDLVAGDTNRKEDCFVHDRRTGRTVRASVSGTGRQGDGDSVGCVISANGRYVTFDSSAKNLVPRDTNGAVDVFVRDLVSGTTTRVSTTRQGAQAKGVSGGPSISGNGRYVVYLSNADIVPGAAGRPWYDVYLHDRKTGTVRPVNVGPGARPANGESTSLPVISADGSFVAFASQASNLVGGGGNRGLSNVYVHGVQSARAR